MPLLSRVLLRDLQLNCLIGPRQTTKQWRHWFTNLKVNRAILDLDDYVVIEFAVKRMKDVVGSSCTIVFKILPIQMMVINERAIENDAAMRRQRMCYYVRGVGRCSAVAGWPGTPFRIRFHHKATKVRNRAIYLIDFALPPLTDCGIEWIKCVEPSDRLWTAQVDAESELYTPGTKCIPNACQLGDEVILKAIRIRVYVVHRAAVDPTDASSLAYWPARVRSSRT